MGFPDNDFFLLRDEPGYRSGEPSDDDEQPAPLGDRGLRALHHSLRGAKIVRASFAIDTATGAVTERAS